MKTNHPHDEPVERDHERKLAEARIYMRRLMAVTVSIAVLGLLAMVAAIVAYQQQQKAKDNEVTARNRENLAKEESVKACAAGKRARDQESRVRESLSQSEFHLADQLSVTQQRREALAFLARAIRSNSGHYAAGRRMLFLLGQHPWFLPQEPILERELEIWDVKYLSASQIILLAESQEGLTVYSAESGQPLFKPFPLGDNNDARFSDDGDLFFTQKIECGVVDGSQRYFDSRTGKAKLPSPVDKSIGHALPANAHEINAEFITQSPDGEFVAIASPQAGSGRYLISLLDAGTRKILGTPVNVDDLYAMRFSLGGDKLLAGCGYDYEFTSQGSLSILAASNEGLGDYVSYQRLQTLQSPVRRATFSPDGNLVLATCHDGTFLLIDGKNVEMLASYKENARAIDFSPTGREFVLGNMRWSAVGHPLLWIEESADHWCPGTTTSSGVPSSAAQGFTATHNEAEGPGTVTIREAQTNKLIGELPDKVDHIAAMLGDRLITSTQTRIQVWDLATLRLVGPPIDHESIWGDKQVSANFHPDGNRIVTVVDNKARIWDASTGKALTNPIQLPGQGGEPSFSPDGTCLLVVQGFGAVEGYVRLWDAQSGGPLSEIIDYPEFGKGQSATICFNGLRLGIPSERGFMVFDLPGASSTIPGWLADLAEAIGGLRVTAGNVVEALGTEERASILTEIRKELHIRKPDAWVMFGRWFLDDGKTRLISPYSSKTTGEYMRERLDENTTEALELATNVAPDDAELFVRLAKKYLENTATKEFQGNGDIRRARFWIRRARAIDPSIKVPVAASRFIGGQTE